MTHIGWIRIALIVCVVLGMGRSSFNEFTLWDDPATIYQNPAFNPPTVAGVAQYWTAVGRSAPLGLYVPVTYTAWGLIARAAYLEHPDPQGIHLNPWLFHVANLSCHVVSTVLVFEIIRLLVRHTAAAALAALLFGLHPVQVEAVAWASGLKDVLSAMLGLLSLLLYLNPSCSKPGKPGYARFGLATGLFVAAMLAKPSAMVLPVIALIMDLVMLRRSWRQCMRWIGPWLVLAVVCGIWTKLSQPVAGVAVAPVWVRPLIALDSIAFYLWKLIWPVNLGLDYGRTPVLVFERGWMYLTPLAPAMVLLILWRLRRPHLLAGAGVFVAALLPVLGFVPFLFQYCSGVADHYLYLAMLGPSLVLASILSSTTSRAWTCLAGVIIALLAIRSFVQAGVWRNDLTLWEHTVRVNPHSTIAFVNRGSYLQKLGDYAGAERDFRRAIDLDPGDALAHDNLASLLILQGRTDEARPHVQAALTLNDTGPRSRRTRPEDLCALYGRVLLSKGQYAEAAEQFRIVLRATPNDLAASDGLQQAEASLRAPTSGPSSQP